jgi:hypothetical protein
VLVDDLEAYVRLLNKIVRLYLADEDVRRWYGLGPAAEALIMIGGAVSRESEEMAAVFSRQGLDAYVADPRDLRVRDGRAVAAVGVPGDQGRALGRWRRTPV